jgi:hypothetical protein
MSAESTIKLKVSVWRDFVPSRSIIFRAVGEQDSHFLGGDSELQQEVFSWQVREDFLAGISDEAARLSLRERLVERFDASRPPSDRRFDALRDFLDEAEKLIAAGASEWTGSQDAPVEDEDTPYRLNPLLALKLHLEWLYCVFSEQPGISVSVR